MRFPEQEVHMYATRATDRTRQPSRALLIPLALAAAVAVMVAGCDRPAPTQGGEPAERSSGAVSGRAHAGEVGAPLAILQGLPSLPPPFTASPFAQEFVVTGAENDAPGADHYFPIVRDRPYGPRSDIPGLGNVDGLDVADMDNDADLDFLACDGLASAVYLYTNDGAGTFRPSLVAERVTSDRFCTSLRVADFNNDGMMDFVVGDERNVFGTFVYLQQAPGVFQKLRRPLDTTSWQDVGTAAFFGVAAGDVDGDGNADVLLLGQLGRGMGEVRLYRGSGEHVRRASTLLFDVEADFGVVNTVGLALFDVEGDGDLDILVGGGTDGAHFVYTNDGAGNFSKPAGPAFDVDAQTGVDAFDLGHDGDHDLAVVTFHLRTLLFVENLGGSLGPPRGARSLEGPSVGIGAPPLP
jgi:hypothetical protein